MDPLNTVSTSLPFIHHPRPEHCYGSCPLLTSPCYGGPYEKIPGWDEYISRFFSDEEDEEETEDIAPPEELTEYLVDYGSDSGYEEASEMDFDPDEFLTLRSLVLDSEPDCDPKDWTPQPSIGTGRYKSQVS